MSFFNHFNKDKEINRSNENFSSSLNKNIKKLKEAFNYPLNKDFNVRELFVKALNAKGAVFFLDGVTSEENIQRDMIYPLMNIDMGKDYDESPEAIAKNVITINTYGMVLTIDDAIRNITLGNAILIIDGFSQAISCSTGTLEHRGVEKPINENVIKGPKEAFIESGKVNRALIRKQIKSERLITESITVGSVSEKEVYIMYMKDIAGQELIDMVKERLKKIEVDAIENVSMLEQYIEDRPYSLVPTVLETERPDRASSFLMEGHVVLIMDSSPSSLIVPVNFWSFFHTPEDHYQRWVYGNFIRLIRMVAIFISVLAPATYIAISNYHIEMLPTELLMAIAATRERLPFPVILEVLLMEIAFELIREGGLRVPTPIGPTIGIVGALILGQAAVEANIVSPILVIIVSITGLSSFAIPEISLSHMMRIYRFIFLAFGATFGFYGMAIVMVVSIAYITSIKSFGVPFLSPFSPHYRASNDTVFRQQVWKEWLRPFYTNPKNKVRKHMGKGGGKR